MFSFVFVCFCVRRRNPHRMSVKAHSELFVIEMNSLWEETLGIVSATSKEGVSVKAEREKDVFRVNTGGNSEGKSKETAQSHVFNSINEDEHVWAVTTCKARKENAAVDIDTIHKSVLPFGQ